RAAPPAEAAAATSRAMTEKRATRRPADGCRRASARGGITRGTMRDTMRDTMRAATRDTTRDAGRDGGPPSEAELAEVFRTQVLQVGLQLLGVQRVGRRLTLALRGRRV